MKSDVITVDNRGNGFVSAVNEIKKVAAFRGLNRDECLQLQLITEEMLSLIHSVTGEMKASFWIESEDKVFDLKLTTHTVMDKEKRYQLLSSATSHKNEAASGFLGKLRDAFEEAMLSEAERVCYELPDDAINDLPNRIVSADEWDRYEQSILRRLADDIKIGIRGGLVTMTVRKEYKAAS